MPKSLKNWNRPLTGQALLIKVKKLKDFTQEEKAKFCGYYKTYKDGTERANVTAFLNAILEAEGLHLNKRPSRDGNDDRRHRTSYRTTVQRGGNLLVGAVYTKQMELQPGDKLEISLGRKHIHLTLITEKD